MTTPETRLPRVGERVRFRTWVERFPYVAFAAGRTATVTFAEDDCIYALVDGMTDEQRDALDEWMGCVQWAGDDPTEEDGTLAGWFWRECEPMGA
jgi:hypothetical protein